MNENQKTSNFLRAINKFAKEQSDAIRHEVEEFKKQEIEKATKEGLEDAYALIQKEISLKKSVIVSDLAKREQESRKRLFVKRNKILESVFADASKKLIEFTETDDYKTYLINCAKDIAKVFDGNPCVIYVKEGDMDKTAIIKENIENCGILKDDKIRLGGIKGYCEAMNVIADNTFDTKLYNEREWFYENCGLKVV